MASFVLALFLGACGGASPVVALPEGSAPADGTGTTILLYRPSWVGLRYRITEVFRQVVERHAFPVGEAPVHDLSNTELRLEADVEVLEVNRHGDEVHARYTVRAFRERVDGRTQVLVPRGRVIDVHRDRDAEDATVSIAGAPVSDRIRAAFAYTATLTIDERESCFEPRGPVPVGGHWAPDTRCIADRFDDNRRFDVEARDLTADAMLTRRWTEGHEDRVAVVLRFSTERVIPRDVPAGMSVTRADLQDEVQIEMPAGPGIRSAHHHWRQVADVRLERATAGGQHVATFHRVYEHDSSYRVLPSSRPEGASGAE